MYAREMYLGREHAQALDDLIDRSTQSTVRWWLCCAVVAACKTTTDSIAGVASWQLSQSAPAGSSCVCGDGIKDLELAPGLESGRLLETASRAQLLTPDPRLHLLGERADLPKSVCLSMLAVCLSMQHKEDESVEAGVARVRR